MKESEYRQLKEQIQANAARRRSEIDAEERKQIESLETVWNLIASMGEQVSTTEGFAIHFPLPNDISPGTIPLAEAIRKVLPAVQGAFGINEVIQLIESGRFDVKKPINPTSVSGALRKLHTEGVLRLIKAGKGKRPSLYKIAEIRRISSGGDESPIEVKGQEAVIATS